jgi:RNA polymerase sigma-70 factor (ECF subfamily)
VQPACCARATTSRRSFTEEPHIAAPTDWESAFDSCYVELCDYVLRLVGSAEAAQDIVQELFLRLWDTRGPRDATRLTRPYLFVAARNSALKYLRHQHVAAAWVERASRQPSPVAETPEDLCLAEELESAVQDAIQELPSRCREIFLLRRRDQLPYEEIAKRAGVSLGTVKSQMWRATVQLRKKLGFILEGPSGVVPIHAPWTSSASSRATARPPKPVNSRPGSPRIPRVERY